MRKGRPTTAISLSPDERTQLKSMRRSRLLPAGIVRRATILFTCRGGSHELGYCSQVGYYQFDRRVLEEAVCPIPHAGLAR
jgi:hypothetical protein